MIPALLQMTNFLCYRNPEPLDFTGIEAACLVGENGHGKSAILDAITWALWGEARGKVKEDVIALGFTESRVQFEFYAGEQRYQVIRQAGARISGRSLLALQLWDGDTNSWRTASGSTARETQAKINDVLKLSYETFVNSAFLKQGDAAKFAEATPAERKRVLAEILELDRYDDYESRAKARRERARQDADMYARLAADSEPRVAALPEKRGEREALAIDLAGIKTELDAASARREAAVLRLQRVQGLRRDLGEAREQADRASREMAAAETRMQQARAAAAAARLLVDQAAVVSDGSRRLAEVRAAITSAEIEERGLNERLRQAEADENKAKAAVKQAAERLASQRKTLESAEKLLERAEDVRSSYQRLIAAREQQVQFDGVATADADLRREAQNLRDTITDKRRPLEKQLANLEGRRTIARERANRLAEFQQHLDAARRDERAVDALAAQVRSAREADAAAAAAIERLEGLAAERQNQVRALASRRDQLQAAAKQGEVACPVCRAPMDKAGFNAALEQYQQEGRELQAEMVRAREQAATKTREREEALRGVAAQEAETTVRRREVTTALATLTKQVEDAGAAAKELVALNEQAQMHSHRLETHGYAPDEHRRLGDVEAQLRSLAYDAKAHTAVRELVAKLTPFERAHSQLEVAEAQRQSAKHHIDTITADQEEARRQVDEAAAASAATMEALAALPLRELRQQAQELLPFEARLVELQRAQANLPIHEQSAQEAQEAMDQRAAECDQFRGRAEWIDQELRTLDGADMEAQAADEHERKLQSEQMTKSRALGGVEEQIALLEDLEQKVAGYRSDRDHARHNQGVYDTLARAFGKQGVQALIIEAALPELEAEANQLLERMTNNRMTVQMRTQNDTQKGVTHETLLIEIADEWGTRDYGMYSGGEAFRINLALRIALSKLLARRAGAPLPTLVIDEGFGTQDAAGRERLIETLNAIRSDFRCLLLVTHIEELKDVFEVHILVRKHADGSRATVVVA